MLKAMISQPMNGLTPKEMSSTRCEAVKYLESKGYEIINSFFADDWNDKDNLSVVGILNIPLAFLSKAIEAMSLCNAVYFVDGWGGTRGCEIEHEIARKYGVDILYQTQ